MNDFEFDFDYGKELCEIYNNLSIGQKVQILLYTTFKGGVILNKYIEGNDWDTQLYIDVLMDTGDIEKHYRCYSGFYQRFDIL